MERKIARDFQTSVKSLLEGDDPETIYATLKAYHQSKDVQWLVDRMITVVDRPSRRPLFDQVRRLIPTKQQMSFDALLPHAASAIDARIRVVRIAPKVPNQPLGFSVRGGFEHGIGFYVSEVEKELAASQRGLCAGDQIIRVNGFCIDECILSEVLQLIKLKPQLILKVVAVGMIPVKDNVGDPVTWRYTDQVRKGDVLTRGDADEEETVLPWSAEEKRESLALFKSIRVLIHKPENVTLGCSIYCGSDPSPGIFVQSIRIGSLAEEVGLDVDDEIVSVNGALFRQLRHSEAVVNLKTPLQLDMIIRRMVKDPSAAPSSTSLMENIRHLESERVAELRLLAADVSADAEQRRRLQTAGGGIVDEDAEARRLKEQFEEQRWVEEEEKRLKKIDCETAEREEKRRLKKETEDRKILDRMEAVLDGDEHKVASNDEDGGGGGGGGGGDDDDRSDGVEALEMVMNFDTEREDEQSVIGEDATALQSPSIAAGVAAARPIVPETAHIAESGGPHLSLSSPPSSLNASPPPPSPPPLTAPTMETRKADGDDLLIEPKSAEDSNSPLSSPSSGPEPESEPSSLTIPKRPSSKGAFEGHSHQLHRFLQDSANSEPGVAEDPSEWFVAMGGKVRSTREEPSELSPPAPPPPPPLHPPPRHKKMSPVKKLDKTESNSTTSVVPRSTSPSASVNSAAESVGSSRRPTLEELNSVKLRPTPKGTPVKTEHVRQGSSGSERKAPPAGLTPANAASTLSTVPIPSAGVPTVRRQPSIPVSQGPAFSSTQRPVLVSPQSSTGGETPRGTSMAAPTATPTSPTAVGTGGDANNAKRQASDQSNEIITRKNNEKPPEKSPRKARRRSMTTSPRGNNVVVNAVDVIPETNIDGREIKVVTIIKGDDPLDVTIEGGTGSPWDGVIVVSRVWEGGAIDKNGAIKTGDQLLMVEGVSLNGISLAEAQSAIKTAMRSAKDSISFVVAVADENRTEVKL